MTRASGQAGFTLLEVIIATVITAAVVSALYAVYEPTLRISRQLEYASAREQTARLVLGIVADDLASMLHPSEILDRNAAAGDPAAQPPSPEQRDQRGKAQDKKQLLRNPFMAWEPDTLADTIDLVSFSTASSLGFDAGYPSHRSAQVTYTLERKEPGGKVFRFIRREKPLGDVQSAEVQPGAGHTLDAKDAPPPGGAMGLADEGEMELADNVRWLLITYIDTEGKERINWSSLDEKIKGDLAPAVPGTPKVQPRLLPKFMRIRLYLLDENKRERTYERLVHLRLGA